MSFTNEKALAILGSMFRPLWSKETLDLVLQHYKGHMENTVESILGHGDGDPQVLLRKLEDSKSTSSPDQMALDEQLAMQIASKCSGDSNGNDGSLRETNSVFLREDNEPMGQCGYNRHKRSGLRFTEENEGYE